MYVSFYVISMWFTHKQGINSRYIDGGCWQINLLKRFNGCGTHSLRLCRFSLMWGCSVEDNRKGGCEPNSSSSISRLSRVPPFRKAWHRPYDEQPKTLAIILERSQTVPFGTFFYIYLVLHMASTKEHRTEVRILGKYWPTTVVSVLCDDVFFKKKTRVMDKW